MLPFIFPKIPKPNFYLSLLLVISLVSMVSCQKDTFKDALNSAKDITEYSLKKSSGEAFQNSELSVEIQGRKVNITVPSSTDRTALIPTISITGKSISPLSGVAQNFTNPVTYTVTAENGDTANYIVTVNLKPLPAIVYFGCGDNTLYALNAATGELFWSYKGTNSFVYSSPTYFNGVIYTGSIDNNVYAFDAVTGAIKWKTLIATTGIESDAVYMDGTVYVGTNDDYMYALDATTGVIKWSFLTGANVSSSPVIINQTVYFGSSDGKMYAVSSQTGQLKWSFQTGAMINQSGAAIVNGVIYVGSRDSYLYAIDANTGSLVWKYYANGISLEQSSPTVSNGVVYIGGWYGSNFTVKGSLYAINAQTGQLVWEKLQNTGISSSPIIADGKLYITADDLKVHALNALTGESLWEKEILPNSSSATAYNAVVYVGGAGSRYFYAFDGVTGSEKWKFNLPNGLMTSSPIVVVQSGEIYPSGDSGSRQ